MERKKTIHHSLHIECMVAFTSVEERFSLKSSRATYKVLTKYEYQGSAMINSGVYFGGVLKHLLGTSNNLLGSYQDA